MILHYYIMIIAITLNLDQNMYKIFINLKDHLTQQILLV